MKIYKEKIFNNNSIEFDFCLFVYFIYLCNDDDDNDDNDDDDEITR
jgi:hypothetical protein